MSKRETQNRKISKRKISNTCEGCHQRKRNSFYLFTLVTLSLHILYFSSNKENFQILNIYIVRMATKLDSENSSCKTQHFDISFFTSNKGKPLLVYQNYLFKCNKTTANKKYRLCSERDWNIFQFNLMPMHLRRNHQQKQKLFK